MTLNQKQLETRDMVKRIAAYFGLDPNWLLGVAMTESSLGLNQKSKTGARGVFQMTSIAMKDLLQEMDKSDDDMIDGALGAAFLYLLKKRWGSDEDATAHFCDPADRHFYIDKVMRLKKTFEETT